MAIFTCLMQTVAVVALFLQPQGSTAWPLTLLTEEQAGDGLCLDGTTPGYYMKEGNGTGADKWMLYFKGGGWCYDETSCAQRANSSLGSNKHFPQDFTFGGLSSDTDSRNPFANWNHVIMWYCDGASFSGNNMQPHVMPSGQKLYFRGKFILNSIIKHLTAEKGLDKATEVIVAGGSAGGLSTFLHADHVASLMPPSVKKVRATPVSGYFLLHNTQGGQPMYPDNMKYVFHMQNATAGVNQACIEAQPQMDQWKCIFANYSYAYSKTPFFLLQSSIDAWQMGNVWHGTPECVGAITRGKGDCSTADITALNGYSNFLVNDLKMTKKFHTAGEGGFVESCIEHCAAQGDSFFTYEIKGTTEVDALTKWYNSDNEPSSNHWYLPCELNSKPPYSCNPTCMQH